MTASICFIFSCRQAGIKNFHIAVGSAGAYVLGNKHKVAIMDATTLQPLFILKDPTAQVSASGV